ncbi:hypothetical protein NECAME_02771 [Necator americanus]|uniref:Uncharacterized protein n=1 Tax=Necator americanus TaxID=51031 RepID=W2TD28_NECAM|nr:hypothetical protein NECAME_02771 [Necator americanus]ETN78907.1 hypothetical protein NECAME_02771 [Necator americanus]
MIGDNTPPPLPKESERAWWDEEEWEREKRSIRSRITSRNERRKELENTVRNALRELDHINRDEVDGSGEDDSQQNEFDRFFTSELHSDSLQPPRTRRNAENELMVKNSGTAKDVLGTTIALECQDKAGEDLQAGQVR